MLLALKSQRSYPQLVTSTLLKRRFCQNDDKISDGMEKIRDYRKLAKVYKGRKDNRNVFSSLTLAEQIKR
jgi:hypothetical protein